MDEIANSRTTLTSLVDLATGIVHEHQLVAMAVRDGLHHAILAGNLLNEAKTKVGHGGWLDWLRGGCHLSERTAQAYMRAAREYPKLEPEKAQRVADLSFRQAMLVMASGTAVANKAAAIVDAAKAEPERFAALLDDMESTGRVDRPYKFLTLARERDAYEARREHGGKVEDLVALAASGYRASAILADPNWQYRTHSEAGQVHTSASNHYETSSNAEIAAFGQRYVVPLAAGNSVLFLWTTWPLIVLGDVADVIRSWGFEPKTLAFNWIKTNPNGNGLHWGNGYWTRSNSEVCLLATRGSPQRLGLDVHQVIMSPVREHSTKPDETHARIERLVAGPYLELFARKPRPGWMTWGDEVPKLSGPQ